MGTALTQYESDPGSYGDVDPFNPKKRAATPTPAAPTLPFATAGQGMPSASSQTPNATAGQGLSPTTPHPLATADPLAFAPPAGSTLPIAQAPSTVGGAPGAAPNALPDSPVAPPPGPPAAPVVKGWNDAPSLEDLARYQGKSPTDPQFAQFQQQNNLDDWWAAHGTGPRYTTDNGVQVDQAALGYDAQKGNVANGSLPGTGTGFNATLDAQVAASKAGENAAGQVGTGVGANPTGIVPMSPKDSAGIKAQPTTPTQFDPGMWKPPTTTGRETMVPQPGPGAPDGGGSSLLPPSMAGPVAAYGGPTPMAPSSNPNDLTNTTLKRDPSIDRFALAKQNLKDWNDTTNPQYEADLRDANRYAFGNGRGYSGIENNAIGDIASQRDTARRGEQNTLLNKALTDTIGDQFNDLGVAERQQGFQANRADTGFSQGLQTEQQKQAEQAQGFNQDIATKQITNLLQNTAFGQQLSVAQLQDFENSTQFQQALQQFYAGQIGDPAAYFEQLAQQWAKPVGGGY